MISELLESFTRLTWSRAAVVLLIVGASAIAGALYESYTHSFRLERSERALTLAKDAEQYRVAIGPTPTPEQLDIYSSAVSAAHAATTEPGPDSPLTEKQLKFLCGLIPWLLMAFVYVSNTDKDRFIGMFGAIILGVLTASALSFLPRIWWPVGNLLLFPVLGLLLVVAPFGLFKRRI